VSPLFPTAAGLPTPGNIHGSNRAQAAVAALRKFELHAHDSLVATEPLGDDDRSPPVLFLMPGILHFT
jgi:hypothetical protein